MHFPALEIISTLMFLVASLSQKEVAIVLNFELLILWLFFSFTLNVPILNSFSFALFFWTLNKWT